jgi:hypothetical protein
VRRPRVARDARHPSCMGLLVIQIALVKIVVQDQQHERRFRV